MLTREIQVFWSYRSGFYYSLLSESIAVLEKIPAKVNSSLPFKKDQPLPNLTLHLDNFNNHYN